MQALIFIGIQATGKSTFYKQHFFNTHVRISLDLLKTRNREKLFLETCLNTHQKLVIDNTNPQKTDRTKYIKKLKENKYEIIGYYFESKIKTALARNADRPTSEVIPEKGILGTYGRLEPPHRDEGFDALYYVSINERNEFQVEEWRDS
ncbi:MAG: AAA family ATPase [bacterium]|nr:AAA family ATPase [bacterium]